METPKGNGEGFAGLTRHGLAMHAQAGCGLVVSVAEHEFVVSALDARIAKIEADARWLLAVVAQLKADAANAETLRPASCG